jgi:hypothetical protein
VSVCLYVSEFVLNLEISFLIDRGAKAWGEFTLVDGNESLGFLNLKLLWTRGTITDKLKDPSVIARGVRFGDLKVNWTIEPKNMFIIQNRD